MALEKIEKWIPGLAVARSYQSAWLPNDLLAGLSVAAVAVPTGIAYAQLAGVPPVAGLYASILPPLAYAFFGSSRQLIVGPDSATCAMLAAAVLPLAAGDPERFASLTVILTMLVGAMCIGGGLVRIGFIANFLSKPILIGFLNGIALSIISSQLGKLFGFPLQATGFFRRLYEFGSQLELTHWPTVALGLSVFVLLRVMKRVTPRAPGPLVAVGLSIAVVYLLKLENRGVTVIGHVPGGFPSPTIPSASIAEISELSLAALGIVIISFCSAMLTARSFAAKNHYEIDPNRDLIALGVANLASGMSRGFAISGADSRTAINDSVGGKTQFAGVFAAAAMMLVLLFVTSPLAYLPNTALAAVLISAAIGLFDLSALQKLRRVSKPEFRHALIAMIGIITVGVLPGVLIAIGLALLRLLALASQPADAILGRIEGQEGFHKLTDHSEAKSSPGVLIYRFEGALVFFNADYFKRRVREVVAGAEAKIERFVFDAEGVNLLDTTGADALEEVRAELAHKQIMFVLARPRSRFREVLGLTDLRQLENGHVYHSVEAAVAAITAAASEKEESEGSVLSLESVEIKRSG